MSTTITKLRAVVEAQTAAAQAEIRQFGATVSQTSDTAAQGLGRVSAVLKGDFSGALLGLGATAAVVGAGVAIAKVAVSMDDMRQRAANVRKELTAYAGGASQAQAATDGLVRATDGGISRVDAMASASRLLGMGLATTSNQVYELSRMAVMLGDKTLSTTDRMASFNAMLANQSIERLDTFGISSGRVRTRIAELQAATAGLSREQAFVNAVLEIGGEKLRTVEAEGVRAASSIDKLTAATNNLKQAAADKIHVSIVVDKVAEAIGNTAHAMSDEGAAERRYGEAFNSYRMSAERLAKAQADLGQWYANLTPLARANYENKLQEAQAANDAALAEYQLATMLYQVANGSGVAQEDIHEYTNRMKETVPAVLAAVAAMDQLTAAQQRRAATDDTARWTGYGTAWQQRLTNASPWDHVSASGRAAYALAMRPDTQAQAARDYEAQRAAAAKVTNMSIANDWQRRMEQAGDEAANSYRSEMQKGMNFSIGLNDLRPGGNQGPNAPGQNGAFEDIYRLQAFVSGGTWGETAAKYGLDKESATKRIQDFQSGKWTPEVMQLIDKDKLTQQIQDAQLGESMMNAVAADLAKASGADQRIVKAMLGLNSGSDGAATQLDLGNQFVPALTSAIDAELIAKGVDLEKRGAAAWDKVETGMLSKAEKSTKFVQMVSAMVDSALANYVPPN